MQDRLKQYRVVVIFMTVCAAGVAVLVWAVVPIAGNPWPSVLQFVVFAALFELLAVNLREGDGITISPVGPIMWVATCFLGPLPAIVSSVTSALVSVGVRCACYHVSQAWGLQPADNAASPRLGFARRLVVDIGSSWHASPIASTILLVTSYLATLVLEFGLAGFAYHLLGGRFLISGVEDLQVLNEFVLPFCGLVVVSGLVPIGEYALITSAIDPIPGTRGLYGLLLRMRLAMVDTALPIFKGHMFLSIVAMLLAYLYSQIGAWGFALAIMPVLALRDFFHQWVETKSAYMNTITTLATYMQHYHPYTRGHLKRVADMSERLARELRLPIDSIRHMNVAGFLHDIGKIGVSEEILDKTSKLTDEEWDRIKEHPVKGAEIISHLEFLEGIVDWIKYHHKWHDGRGYPGTEGVKVDIPIEAAIIATADAFDAMTDDRELTIDWTCDSCGHKPGETERPVTCPACGAEKRRVYREPKSLDDAIDELRRGAGSQFHPQVVKAFLTMVERDGIRINA